MYLVTHMVNNLVLKVSTQLTCVFSLLKVLLNITRNKIPLCSVHTCFIDASKAFDNINHWTLFHKLINCKILLIIVRVLIFWYHTQLVCMLDICLNYGLDNNLQCVNPLKSLCMLFKPKGYKL